MSELKDTDWDLLEALWTLERATARQVTEHLHPRRGWAYSTVKTLLERLVERGVVAAERVGPVWVFRAAVEKEAARRSAWDHLVAVAFGGAADHALHFAAGALTPAQRAELLSILAEDEP